MGQGIDVEMFQAQEKAEPKINAGQNRRLMTARAHTPASGRTRLAVLACCAAALLAIVAALIQWASRNAAAGEAIGPFAFLGLIDSYLHIYLPVADTSVNLIALVGLGFAVGCLSGLFGIGGGFLMTPLLIMLGIPSAQAAASDSCQIVGASSSGAVAHTRMGNVDVKLGLTLLVGGLVGGTAGVQIVSWLRSLGNFDCWIRLIYVVVLGTVGTLMLRESGGALVKNWVYSVRRQLLTELVREGYTDLQSRLVVPEEPVYLPFKPLMDRLPLQTTFGRSQLQASYIPPLLLGVVVGVLTAIMGVGGGFIMVPAMTYLLGVSTKIAIGTSLFQMVLTSINITYQQATTNQTVDVTLAMLLLVGSAVGAQVGAKLGRPLKGHQLRILLGLLVLLVTIKLALELTFLPGESVTLGQAIGGH